MLSDLCMISIIKINTDGILHMQVICSDVRWDGRDLAALSAQFRKELEKTKSSCKISISNAPVNIVPHYPLYGHRWGKTGDCRGN